MNRLPQITNFNVFDIFNNDLIYDENTHSDIIAFLLGNDRQKNGHKFPHYKDVLKALLTKFIEYLPKSIGQIDIENVTVEREKNTDYKGRIDIFIEMTLSSGEKFALVIENKTISFEHGDQLENYYAWVSERYHERFLLIFLSPSGIKPSHSLYRQLGYPDLAKLFRSVLVEDAHLKAFLSLYCLSLEQIGERLPSNLQDNLAVFIKRLIKDKNYSERVTYISSYNNTWIDFEPNGWAEIIVPQWRFERTENGMWGFSFYMTEANGISLELYFLEQFSSFYDQFLQQNRHEIFHKPRRIGTGSSIWMSIYTREILSPETFNEKSELYSQSKSQDILAEVEDKIKVEWMHCLEQIEKIEGILIQPK